MQVWTTLHCFIIVAVALAILRTCIEVVPYVYQVQIGTVNEPILGNSANFTPHDYVHRIIFAFQGGVPPFLVIIVTGITIIGLCSQRTRMRNFLPSPVSERKRRNINGEHLRAVPLGLHRCCAGTSMEARKTLQLNPWLLRIRWQPDTHLNFFLFPSHDEWGIWSSWMADQIQSLLFDLRILKQCRSITTTTASMFKIELFHLHIIHTCRWLFGTVFSSTSTSGASQSEFVLNQFVFIFSHLKAT